MSDRDYQLLIFDWDGTLMDSSMFIVQCFQEAARQVGFPQRPVADYRRSIGLSLVDVIPTLYPDENPKLYYDFITAYHRHFFDPNANRANLFDGVDEVLHSLKSNGYKLAIATSEGRLSFDRMITNMPIASLLDTTRCAGDCPAKPDPTMLLEILDELEVDRDHALMIGDTTFDMQAAKYAKVDVLAVSYGVHPLEALMEFGPVGHIDDISELPAWLGEPPPSKF